MRGSMLLPGLMPTLMVVAALLAAGCDRRSAGAEQGGEANLAAVSPDEAPPANAANGEAPAPGAIDTGHAGAPAPDYAFTAPDGRQVTLAAFRGKPVLLNLWATWCGPCVRELPTLDAMAAKQAGKLTVVTLSQDMDAGKAAPFLAERHLTTLKPYTDAEMRWLPAVTASLPTSILYDADGRERWRLVGDLDWTTPAAAEALAEAH